jgi:hypothetical protein
VARWRRGEEQVTQMIEQRHLQRVAADLETAAQNACCNSMNLESSN